MRKRSERVRRTNSEIIDRCLVVVSTHNAPSFMDCFAHTFMQHDPGYPCDLLVWDCDNRPDEASFVLHNRVSSIGSVLRRPNVGRAQAGYQAAWKMYPKYKYYFFMHDDSAFIRDGWLADGIARMNDSSVENCLPEEIAALPVGKVGYCSYEWGTLDRYFRTQYPAIFRFLRPLLEEHPELVGDPDKLVFQHIADDKVLYSNECLKAMKSIAHIERYRKSDGTPSCPAINEWFAKHYPGRGFIEPQERYNGACWEGYQTWCEFLNDIAPVRAGFRSHNLVGDGYSQEELAYNSFWGSEKVVHFGAHNVFKRIAQLVRDDEDSVRKHYKTHGVPNFLAGLVHYDVYREENRRCYRNS